MAKAGFFRQLAALMAAGVLGAGCGDEPVAPRPIAGTVTLGSAEYGLFAGSQAAGPLLFPAAGPAGAQYLVVGQLATAKADLGADFLLVGSPPPAAEVVAASAGPAQPPSAALRFHDAIRRMEAAAAQASLILARRGMLPAPPARTGPPAAGSQRSFKVCADLDCLSTASVTATARFVGAHCAIYVDTLAPAGGLTAADLAALGQQFDRDLYPIDVNAFGPESDIDGNGVVIILLTPKVNALVGRPDCQTSFVTGFFLGSDLAPSSSDNYNHGEIFYGLVPDPGGAVSCSYPAATVQHLIAATFIHEFQHMISYNQHVLLRHGSVEALWLNEAMSHIAEELGGRHYDSVGTRAADSAASRFLIGDLFNANLYLENPSAKPMVTLTGPGTLEERGGEWLFVRYLVDRFGASTTQRLEQTSRTGDANVVAVTGTPFATLLGRWALALYVSDLPSFVPDSLLTYTHWRFRTTFSGLHDQDAPNFPRPFPLVPAAVQGGSFAVSGTVSSGSGAYVILTQPPSGPAFSVSFTLATGAPIPVSGRPQLAVVRIR